ncbi:MAG: hypothetical protein AVDCRST_MAG41-2509, partial [uncultured Corynebacteriales bacterium]
VPRPGRRGPRDRPPQRCRRRPPGPGGVVLGDRVGHLRGLAAGRQRRRLRGPDLPGADRGRPGRAGRRARPRRPARRRRVRRGPGRPAGRRGAGAARAGRRVLDRAVRAVHPGRLAGAAAARGAAARAGAGRGRPGAGPGGAARLAAGP